MDLLLSMAGKSAFCDDHRELISIHMVFITRLIKKNIPFSAGKNV